MVQQTIQVLIVDDHTIVRRGVRALLEEVQGMVVIGEAANGEEAVAKVAELQPDVILMDLEMLIMDGIEAITKITAHQPAARIIALTSFATDDKVFPAIQAGALGYILKDSEPEKLVEAIHTVYKGEPSLTPSIARKVLLEIGRSSKKPISPDPLTEREIEVLKLVAKGLDNPQIANRLSVADVTIRTHLAHILNKLHLANRVQAALFALHENMVSLEDGIAEFGTGDPL